MVRAGTTVTAKIAAPIQTQSLGEDGIVRSRGAKLVANPQRAEREQNAERQDDGKDEDGRRPQDVEDGAGDQFSLVRRCAT